MEGFKDHINLFNGYIDNFINLNDNSVYEPIKYFLKLPSKRIRPILTMISSQDYIMTILIMHYQQHLQMSFFTILL